ncbi:helix-turn-helix domain-containing protein [Pseudonocardia parietis]|uniref:Transcriptional regulator with XRE-family HTH domain n=1 Tax=Pseudonocardia parietis TaxID=570936 RepID=A0ABS4VQF7_9PSEU|nr:helix-turn-helix transcriptional regulator [Pseudonocardia parietis]MBP2366160.1 transcriptional regulator with XRE-family HTH domain [Pseudonocardia parietis]
MNGNDPASTGPARSGPLLRAARTERGWSQSDAARRLAGLASRDEGAAARPGSLKTQLSRWENGHATPAPEHRALLAELYGCPAAELGLEPAAAPAGDGGADLLRAALGRAAAVDDAGLALLRDQLRATAALDHRLGTAAAHATLTAQVDQLRELLTHCVDPATTTRLAGLLATAALLAGDQERDRGAPDRAWRAYTLAGDAAVPAGREDLPGIVRLRRERLLRDVDAESAPPGRVDRQEPPVPLWVELGHEAGGEHSVRDRTEAALLEALAAHGAGRTEDAAAATSRARRLALRTGSVHTLTRLDELGR